MKSSNALHTIMTGKITPTADATFSRRQAMKRTMAVMWSSVRFGLNNGFT